MQVQVEVPPAEPTARPELEAVKEKLVAINGAVVGFVKAHPAPCLLGALALGYVAGRLARRGSWFGHAGA